MSASQIDPRQVAAVAAQMELLEGQQLNFGINNTRITVELLAESLAGSNLRLSAADVQAALHHQMDEGEVIENEAGVYRSKIAETARCIRLVRQRYFDRGGQPKKLSESMELVEAIRAQFRQRTRPNREQVSIEQLLDDGGTRLDSDLKNSLRWAIEEGLNWKGAAAFQRRAFTSIYTLSATPNAEGEAIVVAGDTGSGKTEAFLFPIWRVSRSRREI